MKKEIKAAFTADGKRMEAPSENFTDRLLKAFTEYFENNPSEFESAVGDFLKENGEI